MRYLASRRYCTKSRNLVFVVYYNVTRMLDSSYTTEVRRSSFAWTNLTVGLQVGPDSESEANLDWKTLRSRRR